MLFSSFRAAAIRVQRLRASRFPSQQTVFTVLLIRESESSTCARSPCLAERIQEGTCAAFICLCFQNSVEVADEHPRTFGDVSQTTGRGSRMSTAVPEQSSCL